MDIAAEMLPTLNDDPDLLKKVKTDDESCVYGYDIERKKYAEFGQVWMFCSLFFRLQWCIKFLLQGRTVNKGSYAPIAQSKSSERHRVVEKPIMDFTTW